MKSANDLYGLVMGYFNELSIKIIFRTLKALLNFWNELRSFFQDEHKIAGPAGRRSVSAGRSQTVIRSSFGTSGPGGELETPEGRFHMADSIWT